MTRERTQRQIVVDLLLARGRVSAHELTYSFGITRSASVIHRLRREGWAVDTIIEPDKQAVYVLTKVPFTGAPIFEQLELL